MAAIVVAALAMSIAIRSAECSPEAEIQVVARVDGTPIHQGEVDRSIALLDDQTRQLPPASLHAKAVDLLIDIQLILDDAIVKDPSVGQQVRALTPYAVAKAILDRNAQAKINDTVLNEQYHALAKQVVPVEEVHARHILVKTEAEADALIRQLNKGADFEALARSASIDPGAQASGGDLGYFSKDKMVPEFADAAFALQTGQYSTVPVHSQFGWHIIQTLDKRTQPLASFDQVKPKLYAFVLQNTEAQIVADLHKAARIERFNADGSSTTEQPTFRADATGSAAASYPLPKDTSQAAEACYFTNLKAAAKKNHGEITAPDFLSSIAYFVFTAVRAKSPLPYPKLDEYGAFTNDDKTADKYLSGNPADKLDACMKRFPAAVIHSPIATGHDQAVMDMMCFVVAQYSIGMLEGVGTPPDPIVEKAKLIVANLPKSSKRKLETRGAFEIETDEDRMDLREKMLALSVDWGNPYDLLTACPSE